MDIRKLEDYMHRIDEFGDILRNIRLRMDILEDAMNEKVDFSVLHDLTNNVKSELIYRAREKGIDL